MLLFLYAALEAAQAHHVVSDYGIAAVEPRTFFGAGFEWGAFDHGGVEGSWQLAAAQAEFAPLSWLSFAARVPVARVEADGHVSYGLADADVVAKVRLHETDHGLIVSGGLGAELPTGDPHEGLGGGHFELNPFLVASTTVGADRFVLVGMVQEVTSIQKGDHDHHAEGAPKGLHGAPFALHADHELRARATGAAVFGPAWAALTAEPILPWTGPPPTVEFGADGGVKLGLANVAAGFTVPVAGEPRTSWRGRFSVTFAF
jgi:hypothetical protein